MKEGACPICASPTSIAFVTSDRNRRLSAERFTYRRCPACRTLALDPVPADLGRYYPPEYYPLPQNSGDLLTFTGPERHKLEQLRRLVSGGRLVEVGPGIGAFAYVAQEAGYETSAIEMDAACCRFLRQELGIEVHETDDAATALRVNGPYDVIAMWHVIEHLRGPRDVLAAAAAALRPGAVLALAAPNPDALQMRVLRGRWAHVDAPRHLVMAPIAALVRIGRELSLEPALVTTTDAAALGWNLFGWRESLAAFAPARYSKEVLRILGSVLTRAAAPVERREGRGSTFTLVLRRPLGD